MEFDSVINLTEQGGNPAPKIVERLQMAHESSGVLYQYYEHDEQTFDKDVQVTNGEYDNLQWSFEDSALTMNSVKRIGVKQFPQIGAIGFYQLLYEERSKVVAPIHYDPERRTKPTFTYIVNSDNTITFAITPPENVTYKAYRVFLKLGKFAYEYVTYVESFTVPQVVLSGTYEIWVVGYVEEGEAVSNDATHVNQYLVGSGTSSVPTNDIYAKTIEITNEGKIKITLSDNNEIITTQSINTLDAVYPDTFLRTTTTSVTLSLTNEESVSTNFNIPTAATIVSGYFDADNYLHLVDSLGNDYTNSASPSPNPPFFERSIWSHYDNVTTGNKTIVCRSGDLIIAVVHHRSAVTVAETGWTLLQTIDSPYSTEQHISVYYKHTTATSESFTVTTTASGRLYIGLVNIRGAFGNNPFVGDTDIVADGSYTTSETPLTVDKPTSAAVALYTAEVVSAATSTLARYEYTWRYKFMKDLVTLIDGIQVSESDTPMTEGAIRTLYSSGITDTVARRNMLICDKLATATQGQFYINNDDATESEGGMAMSIGVLAPSGVKTITSAGIGEDGILYVVIDSTTIQLGKYKPNNTALPWGAVDRAYFNEAGKLFLKLTTGDLIESTNNPYTPVDEAVDEINGEVI